MATPGDYEAALRSLPEAHSLRAAFDSTKTAIGVRERDEHATPSKPQAYFGTQMEAKLDSMSAASQPGGARPERGS